MAIVEGKPTKDKRKYSFKVYYKDLQGNTKQYLSKKYITKSEAKGAERLFMLNINNKNNNNNMTFKKLMSNYFEYKKDKIKITIQIYKNFFNKLECLSNIKLKDFEIRHVNLLKEKLDKQKYSTRYKNNILKFLKSILRYSVDQYNFTNLIIVINRITSYNKNPNELKKEMKIWPYRDFKNFIRVEENLIYKCFFETLYYCGLRKSETNALLWKDVNFAQKSIIINKNISQKV